eukprot:TRINITY_DN2583_c0_g1_i15.p1 TRINITY_DN2583_c0_g1~~TRINITY_DN2583_c0_g1_i15.p1  ORF type:complete len:207 (-),score=38.24 TRINITY_DN2583_c0_g1_i15:142-762(-)
MQQYLAMTIPIPIDDEYIQDEQPPQTQQQYQATTSSSSSPHQHRVTPQIYPSSSSPTRRHNNNNNNMTTSSPSGKVPSGKKSPKRHQNGTTPPSLRPSSMNSPRHHNHPTTSRLSPSTRGNAFVNHKNKKSASTLSITTSSSRPPPPAGRSGSMSRGAHVGSSSGNGNTPVGMLHMDPISIEREPETICRQPVSYTHLTLPTKRIV